MVAPETIAPIISSLQGINRSLKKLADAPQRTIVPMFIYVPNGTSLQELEGLAEAVNQKLLEVDGT